MSKIHSMWIFWDFIILAFFLFDATIIYYLAKQKQRFSTAVVSIAICLCSLAGITIFYGSFIEPRVIRVKHEQLSFSTTPNQQSKLVLISDLHLGPYKKEGFIERINRNIHEQAPDAVLIAGDFVYKSIEDATLLTALSKLAENYPTYAVLGNHDYHLYSPLDEPDDVLSKKIEQTLTDQGIELIHNKGVMIDGTTIWLGGIPDVWTQTANPEQSIKNQPEESSLSLLLTHNPSIVSQLSNDSNIDLILAGHTHGGQIRLPFIGPVPELPTSLGKHYDKGLFEIDDRKLFITSGLGESGPRARLFNPPEIVVLDLSY